MPTVTLAIRVERHVYTVDVIGSSPVGPTQQPGAVLALPQPDIARVMA